MAWSKGIREWGSGHEVMCPRDANLGLRLIEKRLRTAPLGGQLMQEAKLTEAGAAPRLLPPAPSHPAFP